MQTSRLMALGAGLAALLGSCCALPLALLALTGTIGFTATLVPYQKYFIFVTVVLLGFSFYLVYGRKTASCNNAKFCNPQSQKVTKMILWISTIAAALFLLGPYFFAG